MITLTDIRAAINNILKSNFNAPVISQDIEKGFARPSFTTYFDNVTIDTLESQLETSLTVRLYYFPEHDIKEASLEILEMQQRLPMVFGNNLKVKDRAIHISDIELSVVDGFVVLFEFNLLFEQALPTEDAPFMETLQINLNESE